RRESTRVVLCWLHVPPWSSISMSRCLASLDPVRDHADRGGELDRFVPLHRCAEIVKNQYRASARTIGQEERRFGRLAPGQRRPDRTHAHPHPVAELPPAFEP